MFDRADTAPMLVEPANGRERRVGQVVNDGERQFGCKGVERVLRLADDLGSIQFLAYLQSKLVFALGRGDDLEVQGRADG